MDSRDTVRSILDSLRRLVRELRISSRLAESRFGLTTAQLFVLERVAMNQPVSINDLAELTLTHQSSVSVVAQRLVTHGFLNQRPAPDDRRRKELTITTRGRKALKRVPTSIQDRLITGLSAMRADDQIALARLLKTLSQMIGLHDAEPVLFFEKELQDRRKQVRRQVPATTRRKKPP